MTKTEKKLSKKPHANSSLRTLSVAELAQAGGGISTPTGGYIDPSTGYQRPSVATLTVLVGFDPCPVN
jgi:hypothetical protein